MGKKNVRVVVRTKPTTTFPKGVFTLHEDMKGIDVYHRRREVAGPVNNVPENFAFTFDGVLHEATQQQVYDDAAAPVVLGAIEGFNGTVMCYGQTGAGKTFTMTGSTENFEHRGIIPRAISHLFKEIKARPDLAFVVKVSYLEIYNEALYDLLNPTGDDSMAQSEQQTAPASTTPSSSPPSAPAPAATVGGELKIVEDSSGNTSVRGARVEVVTSEEEALHCLFEGETNRTIAEHQMNKRSSRSHCVFTVHLESRSRVESSERIVTSKVHFVDLAGSERLAKTKTEGAVAREAMFINKSLTFLEQVVISLADKKREHVPYRQSRLTNLLKDSLGGNSRTTLVANIWSEPAHVEETLATLRFASRMMLVSNNAVANVQYDPVKMLRKCEIEIKDLKAELAMHDQISGRSHVSYEPYTEDQQQQLRDRIRRFIDGEIEELDFANLRQMRETIAQFKAVARAIQADCAEKLKAAAAAAAAPASSATAPPAAQQTATAASGSAAAYSTASAPASGGVVTKEQPKRLGSAGTEKGKSRTAKASQPQSDQQKAQQGNAATTTATSLPPLETGRKQRAVTPKHGGHKEEASGATLQPPGGETQAAPGDKKEGRKSRKGDRDKKNAVTPSMSGTATATRRKHRKHDRDQEQQEESKQDGGPQQPQQPDESATAEATTTAADQQQTAAAASQLQQQQQQVNAASADACARPVDKNEAFEVFKRTRGAELNTSLMENKQLLRDKRKSLRTVAGVINDIKHEIDTTRALLEKKKEERRKQPGFDEENEVVDEEEFDAMRRIKEVKRQYREHHESLQQLQLDCEYLTNAIDGTRQRLLSEFEDWYGEPAAAAGSESGATAAPDGSGATVTGGAVVAAELDIEEKFDRAQREKADEMRAKDPEAFAYFSALQQAQAKKKGPLTGR